VLEYGNSFILGLTQLFSGGALGLMLLGILVGFAVGILPGLGGPTTLVLMLPFVIKMTPVEAFAFLLGMSAVTNTTGDITSILIGVPGEPTAAATIVDGHPMAKKGEAGRALGAVLFSSLVGAIFGAFALALAIPIARPLVLLIRSPESFMLALLGITFVASLSGKDMIKGLISGGIGLFLTTVGVDMQSGIERYTFGQLFLWDGIGLVPITLGFFAFPEIIDLAVTGSSIAGGKVNALGGVLEGVKDTLRHWWLVIRCSAIGTFTAIIPGMGSATTQWLAYAHAVQSSKNKERFGKGAIEGVLGPGAANNSTLGGSLLTTVAFGIPSSVTTAILLGAFLIHGLVPGREMLTPEPMGHLALTFSFVWINVISNIITVCFCFLFLKQLAKITQIRGSLLIPFIVLLVYLGAFAEKNVLQDLYLVFIFGVLGWVMERLKWPRSPLVLGLVLGPLAENKLFLSIDNYGASWMWHPGVLFIAALTLAGAFFPTFQRWRNREKSTAYTKESTVPPPHNWSFSFTWSRLFLMFLVIIFFLALWKSFAFNIRAGLFPWVITSVVLLLAIVELIREFRGKARCIEDEHTNATEEELPASLVNRRTARIFVWLFVYLAVIILLGFSVGVTICVFAQTKFEGREKWLHSIVLTVVAFILSYVLFERVLHVPFPPGLLLTWF